MYLVPDTHECVHRAGEHDRLEPILFDSGATAGDPDIASSSGTVGERGADRESDLPGLWDIAPEVVGPFGAAAAPSETVTTAMQATTSAFDGTVSSATGDLWRRARTPD